MQRTRILRVVGILFAFAVAASCGFTLAVATAARQTPGEWTVGKSPPTDTFTIPSSTAPKPSSSKQPKWCRAATAQPSTAPSLRVFEVWTLGSVENRPTGSAVFTAPKTWRVVQVGTYHWNYGKGTTALGRIGIKELATGKVCRWQATGLPGQGGVPNAYWVANVSIVLPRGRYQIVDSDWSTWAQNAETRRLGIEWVNALR